jgi:hypothetical protein
MTPRCQDWNQDYPEFGQLFKWRAAGGVIVIDDPILLDGDDAETAWAIALLRECASWGLPVRWHGTTHPPFDTAALHHLPPPRSMDGQSPALGRWRENHRHGSYHFRCGPEFIQVKDARDAVRSIRFELSGPDTIGTFMRCLRPTRVSELSTAAQAEEEQLTADHLLLRVDGLAVTLPARMRRWPVPVDAV